MAAVTTGGARRGTGPAPGLRTALVGTLRSEVTKIRSVRSTYWTLVLLVLAGVAWASRSAPGEASRWPQMAAQDKAGFDPTQASIVGLASLGQLIIVVLGALTITSEYSTGMMRTSLTVMPRRDVLCGAKARRVRRGQPGHRGPGELHLLLHRPALLSSTHVAATLSQPEVLRAVLASALYIALCGLFAFGLGAILRSTAGAITAAYGLLFLLPQLAKALPNTWYADVVRWLPGGDVMNEITSSTPGVRSTARTCSPRGASSRCSAPTRWSCWP